MPTMASLHCSSGTGPAITIVSSSFEACGSRASYNTVIREAHNLVGRRKTFLGNVTCAGVFSRKLAVASWSLFCFSKEGGSPGPECCYLIYQDYTPPSRGSTPPLSSSVPAAAAWSLLLLLASHLRLALGCLLVAAACWLLLLFVCSVLLLLLFGVVGCCWC